MYHKATRVLDADLKKIQQLPEVFSHFTTTKNKISA